MTTTVNSNAKKTTCGICLEMIRQPVVLPKCGHVFCYQCLWDHEGKHEGRFEPDETGSPTASCPYCRTKIDRPVANEAVLMARSYIAQAHRSLESEGEKRNMLLQLADDQLDMVLEREPQRLTALVTRAMRLRDDDPLQAIGIFKHVFDMDRKATAAQADIDSNFSEKVYAKWNAMTLAEQQATDLETVATQEVATFAEKGLIYSLGGKGPARLWSVQLELIRTYLVAGLYQEAREECFKILKDREGMECTKEEEDVQYKNTYLELSSALYHLGSYEKALTVARGVLTLTPRGWPGVHKRIALPLLAMAEQREQQMSSRGMATGSVLTMGTDKYHVTLDGAIEVMFKGFVYEGQWDCHIKHLNRVILQELCDKKAAAANVKSSST